MTSIASKNLFDLLDEDASERPSTTSASKTDKPAPKTEKRGPAPAKATRPTREGVSGNEAAYRDRGAGTRQNRDRETGESRGGDYRGRGRGRGGRGRGRGGAPSDDRHSKTGVVDHEKQVAHGWGGNSGGAEWADEQAGEAIAQQEGKTDGEQNGGNPDAEAAEEEAKTKTLDDYLAEQAEKRLTVGGSLEIRRANEGGSKKLEKGTKISREEEEEDFIAGSTSKKIRERARKEKSVLELDGEAMRQKEERGGDRRGRGGRGRGGESSSRGARGGDSGARGARGGPSRGRGEFRGDRGGARGRGPRGGAGNAPNVSDESAFPSLGA